MYSAGKEKKHLFTFLPNRWPFFPEKRNQFYVSIIAILPQNAAKFCFFPKKFLRNHDYRNTTSFHFSKKKWPLLAEKKFFEKKVKFYLFILKLWYLFQGETPKNFVEKFFTGLSFPPQNRKFTASLFPTEARNTLIFFTSTVHCMDYQCWL